MKKFVLAIVSLLAVASIAQFVTTHANAACSPAALGGTGTCTVPSAGQTLIGNGSSSYTPALLTPGTDIVIQTASGTITIAVNASAFLPSSTVYVATVNGQSGAVTITSSTLGVATNTLSLFNGNGFTTTTIQAVLNSLSATGLATNNSSTGAFTVSSSSLQLGSASQRATSDFLASSTVFVSTVNGQSGAVTIAGAATTTINNTQAAVFRIIGDGTTVTSTVNGATTTFSILTTGNWVGTWQGVNSSTFYLASNPGNYISSSTGNTLYYPLNSNPAGYATSTAPAGSSTQVQFNNGGSLGANAALTFTPSGGLVSTTSTFTTANSATFESVQYADQWPGSDMNAKANAAEAAMLSTGGKIVIPSGTWNVSTTLAITKQVLVECASGGGLFNNGGTTIHDTRDNTGTSTLATVWYNAQNFSSAGTGIKNCNFIGPAGSGNLGSSVVTSSYAIALGGSSGAFGVQIDNVHASGYGTDVYVGSNVSFLNITNSTLNKAGRIIDNPQTPGANGENNRVSYSTLADCHNSTGSTAQNCILIQQSGNVQWSFDHDSDDDCQLASTQFGGTANIFHISFTHWEDPDPTVTPYAFIVTQASTAGAAATVLDVVGGDFMWDLTTSAPNEFIQFGGTLILTGVTGDINNNVTNPVNDFATPENSLATISWSGLSNKGFNTNNSLNTGFTNVYSSYAYSVDGLGYGTSTPAFSFSTSTSQFGNKVQILSNDLEDNNGNKYATSTSGSSATGTPNYVPAYNATGVLSATSSIYQQPLSFVTSTASIAYVSGAIGSSVAASSCAPAAITTVAGDLLVFTFKYNNNSVIPTIGDTAGNTWSVGTQSTTTLPGGGFTFYAIANSSVSDTITASGTVSASTDCQVDQWSGVATSSPLDVKNTTNSGLGNVTSCTSGNITPTQNGDLLLGICVQQSANGFALTPASGWALAATTTRTGVQWQQQSVATTTSSTIAVGTSDQVVGAVLAFKPQIITSPGSAFGIGIGTAVPSTTFDIEGASSTLFVQCFKTLDHSTTSIVFNWIYSSSTALIDAATKPAFCQ